MLKIYKKNKHNNRPIMFIDSDPLIIMTYVLMEMLNRAVKAVYRNKNHACIHRVKKYFGGGFSKNNTEIKRPSTPLPSHPHQVVSVNAIVVSSVVLVLKVAHDI